MHCFEAHFLYHCTVIPGIHNKLLMKYYFCSALRFTVEFLYEHRLVKINWLQKNVTPLDITFSPFNRKTLPDCVPQYYGEFGPSFER